MSDVIIYTTRMCGYCVRAKALLNARKVPFQEIDVSFDPEQRRQLVERTGRRTVPQIFIDGRSIGGYEELSALDRQGALTASA